MHLGMLTLHSEGQVDSIKSSLSPPPDSVARAETLKILLEGKPAQDIDHAQIAAKTAEFSGADLKAVVDRAIETKLQEAIRTGKPTPLSTKDLIASAKSVKLLNP